MSKKSKTTNLVSQSQGDTRYQHQRGTIRDNAIQALLHDPLFRQRVEKKRKGKGSYQRKAKHANRWHEKPDNKVSQWSDFIIGLFNSKPLRAFALIAYL